MILNSRPAWVTGATPGANMEAMPTHVALLKGVNLGTHNRISMADLRRVAAAIGLDDVATYVQSGNLMFTAEATTAEVAAALEAALDSELGVRCDVVVLTRRELAAAIEANPFTVGDPKRLHVIFTARPLPEDQVAAVEQAVAKSAQRGGADRVAVVGATLYLDTPGGIGRSDLAARLARLEGAGTARNWSTVTNLLALLDG